ncbi:MAG TPA: hypothetical protein VGF06_13060 [Terriglobales bacterium]
MKPLSLFVSLLACAALSFAQNADSPNQPNQPVNQSGAHYEGVPIITGGLALNATFEPHENNMNPVFAPIFLVPLGHRALIEAEFEGESDITYGHGEYEPVVFEHSLEYAQLDFFASKYLTVVAGRYAVPFNIYKERFDARWIRNLSEEPLIFGFGDASGNGGELRGAVPLGSDVQLSYAGYFSAQTTNTTAGSDRQSGLRTALFFPKARIETGFSFNRILGAERFNRFGADFSWNMRNLPLDFRAEGLISDTVGKGYWLEGAYRFSGSRYPGWLRRSQAVVRGEQYFLPSGPVPDLFEAPESDATRVLAGWNYWVTDAVRLQGAYGRQFAAGDDHNIWTLGISYRFVK